MSEADWALYERGNDEVKATRDIVATDGMELQLGDASVRLYLTPGHTLGTISTLLPVSDGGEPHVAALWGGTLFNFRGNPDDPRSGRLEAYAESRSVSARSPGRPAPTSSSRTTPPTTAPR